MTFDRQPPEPAADDDATTHHRRYVWFAIGLALVVLAFAGLSITVIVLTST